MISLILIALYLHENKTKIYIALFKQYILKLVTKLHISKQEKGEAIEKPELNPKRRKKEKYIPRNVF